jgi:tRNA (guanine37-N1)-methyltransferase
MESPCVRVAREAGERTRRRLAERELVDRTREIEVESDRLYVPVTDPTAVPDEFSVVDHETPEREPQTVPGDFLDFVPTYERLGDLVLLDEDDPERARVAAEAVMQSDVRAAAVLNRESKVQGEHRTREWSLLAGERTTTVHREYGYEYELDVSDVYFSPRLATERHRVAEQVAADERAVDMFAGVGPYAVPFADRGATVVATDVNERAIEYLRTNAEGNGVAERITAIHGDVRDIVDDYADWADRIVMNLPHSADEFVETALALADEECVIHFYDIQPDEDPFAAGREAIAAAAEEAGYDVSIETEREVRSYAPHEVNVCLDVRVTRR